MEFLTGYAAAKAPYLTYEVEGSRNSRSKPARSNSTSGTATTKKRSRIPGHARTNSTSTNSSGGRTEHQAQVPAPPHDNNNNNNSPGLQEPSGGPDASGAVLLDESAGTAVTSGPGGRADPVPGHHHHTPARRRSSHRERERERERERMSSLRYFQDKQLPATPRLNTQDASTKYLGAGSHSEPASARTPASASAAPATAFNNPGSVVAAVAFPDRRLPQHNAMFQYADAGSGRGAGAALRAESVSSVSGATTTSSRTKQSSDHASDLAHQHRPFVVRNGRTYLADPSLPYPLPVDLEELHRQSLQTMLLMQLYGRPICAPAFAHKPPPRILEVGCGTGFWSMMCYKHYEARGLHKDISFTGIDIVALPPNPTAGSSSGGPSGHSRPDKDMNWRFVQHDVRKLPFPFPDGSFDFVMVKNMSLATSMAAQQSLIEEYIRLLTPGGTIEIWETDHMVRMLRPHVPEGATTSGPTEQDDPSSSSSSTSTSTSTTTTPTPHDTPDTQPTPTNTTTTNTELGGAYIMTSNTPLSTPLNNFLVEYNGWVSRALESRALCTMPCTAISPLLVQEAEALAGVGSWRLAVPLSEIRWEKEGVGGVVTKDGKSYIETKARRGGGAVGIVGGGGGGGGGGGVVGAMVGGGAGGGGSSSSSSSSSSSGGAGALDAAAAAVRRTALMIVVGKIQSLEPVLREASGKNQDEWDAWVGKMMNDLVRENGTSWGECLEVGAWWARKR
ncbi:hypothetical protein N658DRAFT_428223 [Parathielavia hyrcaniae]|uniref:Methyltransferase domain-containing protein n=1 Tax=Parathielavia hyrcaniae TaxID=113614 RepID=A0AAN6Q3A6_9PEZI|nr:hypothetical protein N658DRAFT_428223 [Parathielavia hyrcaniae]